MKIDLDDDEYKKECNYQSFFTNNEIVEQHEEITLSVIKCIMFSNEI